MTRKNDPITKAFSNNKDFLKLLKNEVFDDYFNTFLSLPIFAKRFLYRKNYGIFEVEPPIKRTSHHLLHDRVITWIRINRGKIFLMTGICNEYRLTDILSKIPVCLNVDGYSKEQLLKLQKSYTSKVIDIQRMKRFFDGSTGQRLMQLWIDAERYYRQIPDNCHRFVLREISDKYLNAGSPRELNFSLRQKISEYLRKSYIEKNFTEVDYPTLLVPVQDMVIKSLQEYWMPKYFIHRLNRKQIAIERWEKINKHKKRLTNAVEHKSETEPSVAIANVVDRFIREKQQIILAPLNLKKSSDATLPKIKVDDGEGGVFADNPTILLQETLDENQVGGEDTSSDGNSPTPPPIWKGWRSMSRSAQIKAQVNFESMVNEIEIDKSKLKREKTNNNKPKKLKPLLKKPENSPNKIRLVIHGNEVAFRGDEEETPTTTLEVVKNSEDELNTKKSNLPVFASPMARDQSRKSHKSTLYEAMFYQSNDDDYEADTEDDSDCNSDRSESRDSGQRSISQRALSRGSQNESSSSYVCRKALVSSANVVAVTGKQKTKVRVKLPPLIKTVAKTSRSFVTSLLQVNESLVKVQLPYTESFMQNNVLRHFPEKKQKVLTAALRIDQVAGNPLLEYFKMSGNQVAANDLRFWNAATRMLTDDRFYGPLERKRLCRVLVSLYLDDEAEFAVSLTGAVKRELSDVLMRDIGVTKLMEACVAITKFLMPAWEAFLRKDEEDFINFTTRPKRTDRISESYLGLPSAEFSDEEDFGLERSNMDVKYLDNRTKKDGERYARRSFFGTRMWRAMELAISICGPEEKNVLMDANEWTTDDDDDADREAGSLVVRNKKAQRVKNPNLGNLFAAANIGLVHDYCEGQADILNDDEDVFGRSRRIFNNEKNNKENSAIRLPKPQNFYDILNCQTQFDFFKRFLVREKAETPLLFWTAVESMRTTSKNGKARQGRAHGIVKRYFGPSADYGRALQCEAGIIGDIRLMEKVSPAMLVSAQACVAKSMEENWFTKYLQTFQNEGGVVGVQILPIYGNKEVKSVKQKTRGLWRMFTRNVISFRRGIMNPDTLGMFHNFLMLQHDFGVAQLRASNTTDSNNGGAMVPTRIVVNNKLIYTEKLTTDLRFWLEVERYKEFADAVVLCARLGNYTKEDELIVVKKAQTIVDCFIDSQVAPKIQINISNEQGEGIVNLLLNGIIERGLFHEASLSTFSILMHFWKKFCLFRFLPKEEVPNKHIPVKPDRSFQIATKEASIRLNKIKKICLPPDEDSPKIMFSLQHGLRLALQRQVRKKRDVGAAQQVEVLLSPIDREIDIF